MDRVFFVACLKRVLTQVADAKRRARLAEGTYIQLGCQRGGLGWCLWFV